MLGLTLQTEVERHQPEKLFDKVFRLFKVICIFCLPGDIVYNVGLQQQVTTWKQVFSDEVLVGPHSDTITHTERAQDIQNLRADVRLLKCGREECTISSLAKRN